MEDSNKNEKTSAEVQPPPEPVEERELSLEELDALLEQEDPEFFKSVSAISSDKLSAAEIEDIDRRNFKRRIKDFLWIWSVRISNNLRDFGLLLYRGLKSVSIKSWELTRSGARNTGEYISHKQRLWSRLSRKLKLFFTFVFLGTIAAVSVFVWNFRTHWAFRASDLFITSMELRSTEKFEINDSTRLEPFFNSVRVTPNIFLIQKSVVNIKPSSTSGSNPMAAFEIFLEGINPEVVVEVKEREGMFRDLIHRTTAKFSYDELDTPEGKKELLKSIQQEINSVVRRGQIRAVRLKTFILKP